MHLISVVVPELKSRPQLNGAGVLHLPVHLIHGGTITSCSLQSSISSGVVSVGVDLVDWGPGTAALGGVLVLLVSCLVDLLGSVCDRPPPAALFGESCASDIVPGVRSRLERRPVGLVDD